MDLGRTVECLCDHTRQLGVPGKLDFAPGWSVLSGMNTERTAKAEALFLQGYNCAQSVVHAYQSELGVDSATALKCACGFGAGMGRRQEICGAVTGGVLVLGLRQGRALGEPKAKSEETYASVRNLMTRFEQTHGSCACCELLSGCDLQTETGQREFKEKNYLHERCVRYVRDVVAMLDELAAPPTG
jgi:C_GCAxxG_C_C family probable redox protein